MAGDSKRRRTDEAAIGATDAGDGVAPPLAESAVGSAHWILTGILAISDGAIISVGKDGRVKVFNQGAERIFGYSPGEVVGQTLDMLLPESRRQAHRAHLRAFACGDLPAKLMGDRAEILGRRKSGEVFPAEASISKVGGGDEVILTVILRDVSERRHLEARLEDLARTDSLTGLANRKMFRELLNRSLARARRNGGSVALLFLDLDRFKTINDTLGHRIGDLLLKEVAKRLKSCLRESDVIARLGGDEFTIVTEGSFGVLAQGVTARRNAAIIAKKLIAVMAEPFQLEDHEVFVNTSIGIADSIGGDPDAETLVKHADMAMYRAKEKGGGTYEFHTDAMTRAANKRLELESLLRRGVEAGDFVLHSQPQIDLDTGRVVGVEALARWRRPEAHVIGPDEFIPVAEESGLIVPLGNWVLRTACVQLRAWLDRGVPSMRMAVNLSARQFQDRALLGVIQEALAASRIPPTLLELEVTEGLLAAESQDAVEALAALKALGVRLSIDDFGTGYSSLAYLKDFPVDALKIDRSFVQRVLTEPRDGAIAATVIELAHNLELEVVAEGVEEDDQMAWLTACGCDAVQGFLIARPMPADACTEWLEMRARRGLAKAG